MKRLLVLFSLILSVGLCTIHAQPIEKPSTYEIPQQSVYMELGGNALFYSLNYDVLFKNGYGLRLGGSFLFESLGQLLGEELGPYSGASQTRAVFGLVMGHKMIGSGPSKLELGAGVLFGTIYDSDSWDSLKPPGATFSAGYRLFPSDSGKFTFKAALTPIITRDGFHPRFGISLGMTLTPEGNIR